MKRMFAAVACATLLLAGAGAGTATAAPTTAEMSARYTRALASTNAAQAGLVRNAAVVPHWVDGGGFWYRRERADGGEFRLVRPSGQAAAAFDHARLSAALSRAAGSPVGPWALNVTALEPGRTVDLLVGGKTARCLLKDYRCSVAAPAAPNPRQALSPDGRKAVFVKGHDLWLRDLASGRETALTNDGEAWFAWGKVPDAALLTLVNERRPLAVPPWGATWSPDGRYLVASRIDERPVKPYPFLESVPQDGSYAPIVRTVRVGLLGQPQTVMSAAVFDTVTGKRTAIALPAGYARGNIVEVLGWSADGRRFYTALAGKGREIELTEVDVSTGERRTLATETPKGFIGLNSMMYSAPNVRIIDGGREILWYSQRSGWGHLYRYDLATGKLLNAVTSGDWLVRDILHVDEARRRIVFTGTGRDGSNPYRRRVYRVNFDGSDLRLLTPEDADHSLEGQATGIFAFFFGIPPAPSRVSPDGAAFIDTFSTPDTAPVSVLRSTADGRVIARLETADISALTARGWRPPESFVAKAADGKTDLYGAIWWPDAAMGDKVPVIDNLYGGPQTIIVTPGFATQGWADSYAMTQLGFAVVTVDGRGTPGRSQAFQDESFANFGDTMAEDHAAVMRQLVARYPRLDGERIGVTGHSFGGYVSVRTMLRHPEVFKVGVSSAGPHVYEAGYDMRGLFGDADFRALGNASLAANLRGRLLLGYGDLDENAWPAATLQFIDALTKAGRRYDLVYMPNATHRYGGGGDYFTLRRWDYFTEHLLGVDPPLAPYGSRP